MRPGRHKLAGTIEVDEIYLGGQEGGIRGRQSGKKALIVVAAQEDGKGIGRIRMRAIPDASADHLVTFIEESVESGSTIHTDAWLDNVPLERKSYVYEFTFLKGKKESPSELLPRVHHVVSLLKRRPMRTHHGAVSHEHLHYYLDEFTFRFNRR